MDSNFDLIDRNSRKVVFDSSDILTAMVCNDSGFTMIFEIPALEVLIFLSYCKRMNYMVTFKF